uniref:Elongation of very long chain fatty acids protein n=1 Tax=Strongyloides venezuelensis TaxID=75913 RepID=A0A0K0EXN5_STRVS
MSFSGKNMASELLKGLPDKILSSPKFDLEGFLDIVTSPTFDENKGRDWIIEHFPLTIQLSIIYVITIFSIKFIMKNREPFQLTIPLNIWNAFLSVFSITGTIMLSREFFTTVQEKGIYGSYCKIYDMNKGANGYWVWLFMVSKMFELIDTIFLVLRKKPLMFLHWYHHILTVMYSFFSYPYTPGFNRWGIYLNFFVHAFMYTYYFIASMKIRVPKAIAQSITTIQILQFIISNWILLHLFFAIYVFGANCDFDDTVFKVATVMEVSYLALFINFFIQRYIKGGKGGKGKSKKVKSN